MGHPHCNCPVFIFRYHWQRCWATFPPANVIFAGIGVLLLVSVPSWFPHAAYFGTHDSQAAKDASASQDKLIELFDCIERFFGRLEIYTGIAPTAAMTGIIIDIMVEVLTVLAIATKEVKRERSKKYMKRLMGSTDLDDGLGRLNKLTQEKAQMASAELLKMTRSVDGKVMGVDDRTKSVKGKVQNVRDDVQEA
ncbi:hypothetical protein BJV77DRAFT_996309 [Russula vinacea]|nr:hypothetical protein BJV77DRAFT_996309 [Russula vinacea]